MSLKFRCQLCTKNVLLHVFVPFFFWFQLQKQTLQYSKSRCTQRIREMWVRPSSVSSTWWQRLLAGMAAREVTGPLCSEGVSEDKSVKTVFIWSQRIWGSTDGGISERLTQMWPVGIKAAFLPEHFFGFSRVPWCYSDCPGTYTTWSTVSPRGSSTALALIIFLIWEDLPLKWEVIIELININLQWLHGYSDHPQHMRHLKNLFM